MEVVMLDICSILHVKFSQQAHLNGQKGRSTRILGAAGMPNLNS
jgi:hypothetical protein